MSHLQNKSFKFYSKSKRGTKAKNKQVNRTDNRGNWEYNDFQKVFNPNFEAIMKVSMKPSNGFNPKNIHEYINHNLSKEEIIENKVKNKEKLNTKEKIIYENYILKRSEALKKDINDIKTLGMGARPETGEGRTRLLLFTLDYHLKKNNIKEVSNIYLRLMEDQFILTEDIKKDYSNQLLEMERLVKDLDMLERQFTIFHKTMPPLNHNGFKKLDPWQIKTIENIDKNISTVINAPTSAGKTVLSSYVTTKGKTLFVVPTVALALHVAAHISPMIDGSVPILTETYQTNPSRDAMIILLNNASTIVGTPEIIIDYLPFIKCDFKWLIFDEIHMIGKMEGSGMEHIIKVLNNIPFLALSATIGNTDYLVEWFKKVTDSDTQTIDKIICNKRFFNMQKFYSLDDNIVSLHPLALIDEEHIRDSSILNKTLQPCPNDAWSLQAKLQTKFKLEELDPYLYFDYQMKNKKRIELDEANQYFNDLIKFIVAKYKEEPEKVMEIINSYKQETLESGSCDLIKLAYKLKDDDKLPGIFFLENTLSCLTKARLFAKELENMEQEKYPRLIAERLKLDKSAKKLDNSKEKDKDITVKTSDKVSRKEMKHSFGTVKLKKDGYGHSSLATNDVEIDVVPIQEPHPDFNLNNNQFFSESMVNEWALSLKKYFPPSGEYHHFMIKLLWRGVGVYAKGLPDPYLHLVQSLACKKQLAVVFSDKSLVFGVSMPFRSVVIIKDDRIEDKIDPMLYHQMAGRAGRRGLDKEGNIIFAGFSWRRIKELSISEPPIISGYNNTIYADVHGNQLSSISKTNQEWTRTHLNSLNSNITVDDAFEFAEGIKSNYDNSWSFAFQKDDINHLHMNWRLRYSEDCVLVPLLIPYLQKAFDNKDHKLDVNQLSIAHFLARFLCTKITNKSEYILEDHPLLSEYPYNQIFQRAEELQLNIISNVDNRVYKSLVLNSIPKNMSDDTTNEIRMNMMDFSSKIRIIQHYCFHTKIVGVCKLLGKLLTRIWWVCHTSSPVMKPLNNFDNDEIIVYSDNDSDEEEEDSDNEEEFDSELSETKEETE